MLKEAVDAGKLFGPGAKGPEVEEIQRALLANGAVLKVDGNFGPITFSAMERFQAEHSLTVDGWVGPESMPVLLGIAAAPVNPRPDDSETNRSVMKWAPWLAEMRAITGVREVPGGSNSPIIMSWRGDIARAFPDMASYAATYTGDAIPWCGFGLARCFAVHKVRPANKFMWALSWASWGKKLKTPVVGCVMTFSRAGGGHVALLEKISGDTVWVRGCNQSDMVNVARRSMSGFKAATWPSGHPIPTTNLAGNTSNAVEGGSVA